MSLTSSSRAVHAGLSEGTVIGFITYVQQSNPNYTRKQVGDEVAKMLAIIKWDKEAIEYWIDYYRLTD